MEKLSDPRPRVLAYGLALLIAACGMLLSTSGAEAAANRGAVLVKDIHPGRSGSSSGYIGGCYACYAYGGPLAGVGGTLYLSVDDGRHGFELWRSDGRGKGTRMVKDINPGSGSSDLYGVAIVGRILYFSADDGIHGSELWRSDGTARGTRLVKDINPGTGTSAFEGGIGLNGILYFPAYDGTERGAGLWRTDGTQAGTRLVKPLSGGIFDLTTINGTLYFDLFDGGSNSLWRSDGTDAGTTLIKKGFASEAPPFTLDYLTGVGNSIYFLGDDGVHGTELWRTDGTEAGTTMVKDITPAGTDHFGMYPGSTFFGPFTVTGRTLYFMANDGTNSGLWRSDGTEAGTNPVKDFGRSGDFTSNVMVIKGKKGNALYFFSTGGLWRSDGTARGTKLVWRGLGGPSVAAKSTIYFVSTDKRHGEELWRSDGTRRGTKIVRDIRRGTPSSHPQDLLAVGSTLYFTAKDGRHGRELWRAGPPPCAKGKCKKG